MKKRLLGVLLTVGILCGCLVGCADVETMSDAGTKSSEFVIMESASDWWVVYDKNTKVEYVVSRGGYNAGNFTVLVDSDGKPLLYTD